MGRNTRIILIVLGVLLVIFLVNNALQNRYQTKSAAVFPGDDAAITRFTISQPSGFIELVKIDDQWTITGADSLVVRQPRLNALFDRVLTVEHETLVSKNPEKWDVYSVNDSLGVNLKLYGTADELLGDFYFGQSKSDWAHNYYRQAGKNEVYLTSANVIYNLNPTANYWGEKPKPPEPDTSAAALPAGAISE